MISSVWLTVMTNHWVRQTVVVTHDEFLFPGNKTGKVRRTYYWGALFQPLLTWESNKYYVFWERVYSLRYPACKAHVPFYIVICGLSSCAAFLYIILQMARFSKEKYMKHKICVWIFSTTFCERFLNLRGIERHIIINVHMPSCKVPVILVGF
jgi:hypothetical protein